MPYNPNALHYKIVWNVSAPPVHTTFWDDTSWLNWAMACKPSDYHGDPYNQEEWLDYVDQKNLKRFQEQWPNSNVTLVGRDRFHFEKKEV